MAAMPSIVETVPVIERFQGKTVWEGEVEVFDLVGHPKATRGYGWAYDKAKGSEVAVLELPPVISQRPPFKRLSWREGNPNVVGILSFRSPALRHESHHDFQA